jgi:hypothetical protein
MSAVKIFAFLEIEQKLFISALEISLEANVFKIGQIPG